MTKLKKGSSIILVIAIMLLLFVSGIPEGKMVKADASSLQSYATTFGRTFYQDNELKLAWTNSGFSFSIDGTGAKVDISTTNTHENLKGYINVYVDDSNLPTKTIAITKNDTYTLAENLSNGIHKITVKKRNEAAYGGNATLGFSNLIVLDGSFKNAPEKSNRKIEIVGDSITSGFGNLVTDGAGDYSSNNTEGTLTYAALTGKSFGTETTVISRSGIRFVRVKPEESMTTYYEQISGLTGNTNAWNFDGGSDVVVINLGTNDAGTNSDEDYIKSEAKDLIRIVRNNNPNAIIIWAYGIMGTNSKISNSVKAAINETDDPNLYYLSFDYISAKREGMGVAGHPTITTSIDRSFDLVEFIAEKTGWDYNYDVQLDEQIKLIEDFINRADFSKYSASSATALKDELEVAKDMSKNGDTAENQKLEITKLLDVKANLKTKIEEAPGLDRIGWTATASNASMQAVNAIDNNISTRWATLTAQEPGQWFILDTKKINTFNVVEMLLDTSVNDNPSGYKIYVSVDGENWDDPVLEGTEKTEEYEIGTQTARYVKIEQTGTSGGYWSIHELNLKNVESNSNDSYVSSVTPQNSTVNDGDKVPFSAMIRNMGENETGDLKVEIYLDNKLFDTIEISGIDAHENKLISTNEKWTAFWGSHTVRAIVYENGEIHDVDLENNSLKQKFVVSDN